MKNQIVFVLLLFSFLKGSGQHTSYYVDNVNGNNNNNGEKKNTAWRSLDKLNSIIFQPGDHIYLKRGQVFNDWLHLKGSGKDRLPIKLSAFGVGNRPAINAAEHESAIKILDADHWEIADIETIGGNKAGIFIGCTKDDLALNHIRIANCYVHDIGDTSKVSWDYSKSTGGIIVVNGTFDNGNKPVFYNSVFNDVDINNCIVRYNHQWTCISISSGKINGQGGNANYIRNCTAEFSSADGIRMNGVRNSFIEYCVMYRNGAWPKLPGRNLGGLGAWFFDGESCTIQFCEAGYVRGATNDAGAFDIDYWQFNSKVQYCYGHDCAGYGVSVFGADSSFPTKKSVVRYNIFSNNGRDSALAFQGDFFIYTWNGGLLNGVNVHDNVSYWDPVLNAASLKFDADFAGNNPNTFRNNIIYAKTSLLDSMKNTSLQCDSNSYCAMNGKPAWQLAKDKYYSLQEWQKATGQDIHSNHVQFSRTIPAWYKYQMPEKAFRKNQIGNIVETGKKAPGFSAYTTGKQKINFSDYTQTTVLLSFINTSGSFEKDRILSQLTFIRSMKRQYADKGFKIILIDESYLTSRTTRPNESLLNFIHDQELEDIPIIQDNKNINIAGKYGVTIVPSTFLISTGGLINQKWENIALPAQLAFGIENAVTK